MGQNSAPVEERLDAATVIMPPLGAPSADPLHASGRYHTPGVAEDTIQIPAPRATHRRTTTARPVRPEDRVVVERTTELLRALALVEPPAPLTPLREDPTPVTVIPTAGKLSAVLPLPRAPQRTVPRSLHLSLGLWLIAATLVSSILYVATPIGAPFIPRPFAPHAAQVGFGEDNLLSAPWASSSLTATLEIGGGAGPGVHAPGSAGLPVTPAPKPSPPPKTPTPKTPTPRPQNPPSSNSRISPTLVSPWPPANPWMYVPHHPAFAVNSSGGFYSWTFGQCT